MNKTQPHYSKTPVYVSLAISILAFGFCVFLSLRGEAIVYVDSMKLLSEYKGTLQAKAAYEKKVAVWKANVDTLTTELNAKITQYEKEKKGLSARERKLTEELIVSKQQQLENYKAAISENATKEDQTITTQVFKEIGDFVKRYGEDHGYAYILGATNMGNVVYAQKGKNITDEVLKELNAHFQPGKK